MGQPIPIGANFVKFFTRLAKDIFMLNSVDCFYSVVIDTSDFTMPWLDSRPNPAKRRRFKEHTPEPHFEVF
jgi:hypothetical protein|tara:strand:- start:690 stop:902 length:213 start_codon:yes stop_codon:yes gene_type:complete